MAVYFLFQKEWKNSLATVVSFGAIYAVIEGLKKVLWGSKITNFAQSNILFLKDAYDPSKGQEDMAGFIERFLGNVVIYLSGRFWEILGFKKENGEFPVPLAFLTVALLIIGLIVALRKNKNMFWLLCFIQQRCWVSLFCSSNFMGARPLGNGVFATNVDGDVFRVLQSI